LLRTAVLSVVLCVSVSAAADPSVGVVITGDDAIHSTGQVEIETWLGRHNFSILVSALDKDGVLTLSNCLAIADLACARGVVEKRSRAESIVVIVAQASGSKRRRDIQLSAYWITKNHDVVSLQKMCNHCTKEALPENLDALMVDLSKLFPAMTGKLKVSSTPPGLLVTMDGDALGVTPLDKEVPPGDHKLAITRDGKVLDQKDVTVTAGETATVEVHAPAEVAPPPPPPEVVVVRKSRAVPTIITAVGVAGIATGAVMIALGGPTGASAYYMNYRTPGYFVAGGGAAVAIVGAILFLHGGSSSTPTAALTPGGATVGWAGRF
jgi:hypothetical protein